MGSATIRMGMGTITWLKCWWAVVNLAELDEVMRKKVADRFDHANLNLDPLFVNRVPTTENLCMAVFELLNHELPAGRLAHVRVEETEKNFFQYDGE
jgi:6-pyruvoyltetrahydropterin/6-carboxytetrahydropterin synthase